MERHADAGEDGRSNILMIIQMYTLKRNRQKRVGRILFIAAVVPAAAIVVIVIAALLIRYRSCAPRHGRWAKRRCTATVVAIRCIRRA